MYRLTVSTKHTEDTDISERLNTVATTVNAQLWAWDARVLDATLDTSCCPNTV